MKKTFYAAVAIIIIIVAGTWLLFRENISDLTSPRETPSSSRDAMTGSGPEKENVKAFALKASSFQFDVKEIRVKRGDRVKITLTSTQGFHDWVLDEFGASVERVQAGQTSSVEFLADKAGTFEYYCSVGTHRQMGMVGKLIVEE